MLCCSVFLTGAPDFDLPCSTDDRGDAAGVQLQQSHLSCGKGGEKGTSRSLSPTHVPAGQTELQPIHILGEETLTECQTNATAGMKENTSLHNIVFDFHIITVPY